MSARNPDAVWQEIRALGRPTHPLASGRPPGDAGALRYALAQWRCALAAWREAYPDGDQRYEALLAELDAYEREVALERQRRAAAHDWASGAVPARVLRVLEAYRADTSAARGVARWLAGRETWLVLTGGTGSGKSCAAAWALRTAHESGRSVAWVQSARLAADAGRFEGAALAERLRGVDILVVDDVGAQDGSAFARDVLRELLTERHEEGHRSIITTNLDAPALRAHLGDRLSDRVRASVQVTQCREASLRGAT